MYAPASRVLRTQPITRWALASSTTPTLTTTTTTTPSTAALINSFRSASTSSGEGGASTSASVLPAAFRAPTTSPTTSTTLSNASHLDTRTPVRRPSGRSMAPIQKYRLSVFSTRNNTILTLTTKIGNSSSSSSQNYYRMDSNPTEGSDVTDSVVAWVSAGSAGYKGASRGTYDAAVEVSIKMFNKIRQLIDPNAHPDAGMRKKNSWPILTDLEIVWNGFGQGRDAVFRTLMAGDGDYVREKVNRLTDATPLKVGGTRPKKRRVI